MLTRASVILCLALALSETAHAQDSQAGLEQAKKTYTESLDKSRAVLLEAFAAASKAATASGSLDAVKAVQAEREAFEASGKLPASARMKTAAVSYQLAVKQASGPLERAYEQAVRELTKAGMVAEAEAVQSALKGFRSKTSGNLRPADVTTKEDLQQFLAGTTWNWGDGHKFKPDGYVENRGWDVRGLVTRWQAIDRRTVIMLLEKGRDSNRIAVLTFSEDITEFAGYDFENTNRVPVCKRKP